MCMQQTILLTSTKEISLFSVLPDPEYRSHGLLRRTFRPSARRRRRHCRQGWRASGCPATNHSSAAPLGFCRLARPATPTGPARQATLRAAGPACPATPRAPSKGDPARPPDIPSAAVCAASVRLPKQPATQTTSSPYWKYLAHPAAACPPSPPGRPMTEQEYCCFFISSPSFSPLPLPPSLCVCVSNSSRETGAGRLAQKVLRGPISGFLRGEGYKR